jgi:integrase
MTGHVRRRGEKSFELKFDASKDATTGKRRIRYASFKGTKREAEAELIRLVAEYNAGLSIDPSSAGTIRIDRSLEQTKGKGKHVANDAPIADRGLRFKAPKTKHGRRTISLPPAIVTELKSHLVRQQERRLALGMGRAKPDDLLFARWDGHARSPHWLTQKFGDVMRTLKIDGVTVHSLRHTHASQLIAAGMDVLTISRRLGHGSPTITLSSYGHLFRNTDERAAEILEATFAKFRP